MKTMQQFSAFKAKVLWLIAALCGPCQNSVYSVGHMKGFYEAILRVKMKPSPTASHDAERFYGRNENRNKSMKDLK